VSRIVTLLNAIAGALRAAKDEADAPLFTEARVELDRYDLGDLVKDSTRAPSARVCFLAAKPIVRADAGIDMDVSVAIIVIAGRIGQPDPKFSSADLGCLERLSAVLGVMMADPYVGLTQVMAAEIGNQLVAVSDQTSGKGLAIGLQEYKWRLLNVAPARPVIQRGLETGLEPSAVPSGLSINGGDPEPRLVGNLPPEDAP